MISDKMKGLLSERGKFFKNEGLLRSMCEQLEPLTYRIKDIAGGSGIGRLIDDIVRGQNELARAAYGPLEDLKRSGILESLCAEELKRTTLPLRDLFDQFRMPTNNEISNMIAEIGKSISAANLIRFQESSLSIRQAIEAIAQPWFNKKNGYQSIVGFAGLQSIGLDLKNLLPFDIELSRSIRDKLGDWRSPITLPKNICDDFVARTSFYKRQGLDQNMAAFPAGAFQQSLLIAGLDYAPPPRVTKYIGNTAKIKSEEDFGIQRTNKAHECLLRFETQIRRFVDKRMKALYGENWIKQRIPEQMREDWKEKRRKAKENGESEWPLIAYADFTDYVTIITKADNWETVFKDIFKRKEDVKESFQRLYPIRLCTMHSRIITQDDEIYLQVETKRLLKAIGIVP